MNVMFEFIFFKALFNMSGGIVEQWAFVFFVCFTTTILFTKQFALK